MTEEFSVKDFCRLLAACKENGVTELKNGELHLRFGTAPTRETETITPEATIPLGDQKAQDQENERLIGEQLEFADREDTSLMVIEDPAEMERKIASGEFVDEVIDP